MKKTKPFDLILIFLFVTGIFVHSFYLPAGAFRLKILHVSIFIIFFGMFFQGKIYFPLNRDPLIIPFIVFTGFSLFASFFLSVDYSQHFMLLIFLVLNFSVYLVYLYFLPKFCDRPSIYFVAVSSVMITGIIFYFIALYTVDMKELVYYYVNRERLEITNSIKAFLLPEYGGLIPRFNGFHIDPNFWAGYSLFSLWSVLTIDRFSKGKSRILHIALVSSFLSLILTLSRAGIMALLIGMAFYFLLLAYRNDFRKIIYVGKKAIIILSISVFGFVLLYHYYSPVEDFLFSILDLKLLELGENVRVEIWNSYFSHVASNPFHGVGLRRDLGVADFNPHNTLLYVTTALGIFGLFFYLCIHGNTILFVVHNIRKRGFFSDSLSLAMAGYISMLALNFFIDGLYDFSLWCSMALMVGICKMEG